MAYRFLSGVKQSMIVRTTAMPKSTVAVSMLSIFNTAKMEGKRKA